MEDSKVEERKNFMKPAHHDPLRKREEFAVSLRKKKTQELINAKRRRLAHNQLDDPLPAGPEHVQVSYKGYAKFDEHPEVYNNILSQLLPEVYYGKSLTIVRHKLIARIYSRLNASSCSKIGYLTSCQKSRCSH